VIAPLAEKRSVPSNAFINHLVPLLADAKELDRAHGELRTGKLGRRYGLTALPRSVEVMCISAWEAYVEELVRESIASLRPPVPPLGLWPALNASVRSQLGQFNTPNTEQVRSLISDALGLPDIQRSWTWHGCTSAQAVQRLAQAMEYRHQIAHGAHPRPVILSNYSRPLSVFFRRLAQCTDHAVRAHLVDVLGIAHPWPA
jgi:hypothetical protein